MGNCCGSKRELFKGLWEAAKLKAKQDAQDSGETMTIIKEGGIYQVKKASEVTKKGIEYFSKYS